MPGRQLKITRIGNSKGIRLPAETLARYGLADFLVMEERSDGILLRPPGRAPAKLSWEETAREMGAEREDWFEWDSTLADGLERIPWNAPPFRRVAERTRPYRPRGPKRR